LGVAALAEVAACGTTAGRRSHKR